EDSFLQNKRLIAPLLGYPGIQYTNNSKTQVQLEHEAHYETIMALTDNFQPDIVFPLMDISREVHALGRKAVFHHLPLKDEIIGDYFPGMISQIEKRVLLDSERITEYLLTLELLKKSMASNQMLCAYISGPVSLAGMIMGMNNLALSLLLNPDAVHNLLSLCLHKLNELLPHLKSAGAQAICFLEPTASLLSPLQATEFSLDYLTQLISTTSDLELDSIIHICGNTSSIIELMTQTGASAISLDSPATGIVLSDIFNKFSSLPVLMGNINPSGAILTGTPQEVRSEVDNLLDSMKDVPDFILSTGCDLPQESSLTNIKAFFDAARNY
ncbi:MAG: uroporphyrinogen decarboxylase family protein, partial [Candidatus Stygibacter frigidus]|nr:uroporphyrinogen decarboxylase family protein [Candidatus Stygibacter frigidus]